MNETEKIYVVTALDSGDTCDGIPEKVGQFSTREEAEEYVRQDMRGYCDNYTWVDEKTGETHGPKTYDEDRMFIESSGGESSCQWTIIEVAAPSER